MPRTAIVLGVCLSVALGTLSPAEAARGNAGGPIGKARPAATRPLATKSLARKKWPGLRLRRSAKADPATTTTPAAEQVADAHAPRARPMARLASAARDLPARLRGALVRAARWSRAHPVKAVSLATGAVAMLATAFWVAPALKIAVTAALEPLVGPGLAGIAGVGLGGALASGTRSLMVHVTPMSTGVDPWNSKQLAVDVGMSTGFGFIGFAQAAGMTALTDSIALGTAATAGTMLLTLVGYEMVKDFIQIKIRNRVASYPKNFSDRRTFTDLLAMETASNAARALPGMSTVYWLKVVSDIAGTVWYDRSVNRHEDEEPRRKAAGATARPDARGTAVPLSPGG
jgi:hypothetical protein